MSEPTGYAPAVGDEIAHDGCHPVRITKMSPRFVVVVVNGREQTLCREEFVDATQRALAKGAVRTRADNNKMRDAANG